MVSPRVDLAPLIDGVALERKVGTRMEGDARRLLPDASSVWMAA